MTDLPRLVWASPGHGGEYTLNLPGFNMENFIPRRLERLLADALPSFRVDNRGTRLELINRAGYGLPDHDVVLAAVTLVFGAPDFKVCTPPPPVEVERKCPQCPDVFIGVKAVLAHMRAEHPR